MFGFDGGWDCGCVLATLVLFALLFWLLYARFDLVGFRLNFVARY